MKSLTWIRWIFALIGVAMLVGTFAVIQHTRHFLQTARSAPGVVVELVYSHSSDSTVYKPRVRFVSDRGETVDFVSKSGSNPAAYDKGEQVEVLYDSSSPRHASINSFLDLWLLPLILGVLGAIFAAIGFGMMFWQRRQAQTRAFLQQSGMPVESQFKAVEINTGLTVNGRHPWRVISQWHDPISNEVHVFESENLWFDPSDFINQPNIKVLMDRNNSKRYWMDLSFLPKQAT